MQVFGIDAVPLLTDVGRHFYLRQVETARNWVILVFRGTKVPIRLLKHSLGQVESIVTGLEKRVSSICLKPRCLTSLQKGRLGRLKVILVARINRLRC